MNFSEEMRCPGQQQRARYISVFLDTAKRTILAMMDAGGSGTVGTCCIFNLVGGGAFLRGLDDHLKTEIRGVSLVCWLQLMCKRGENGLGIAAY